MEQHSLLYLYSFRAKLDLLQRLRKIDISPRRPAICGQLWPLLGESHACMQALFQLWPKFSGNPSYPVPGATGIDPRDAYDAACGSSALWADTEYGNNRKELLAFCIQTLGREMQVNGKFVLGDIDLVEKKVKLDLLEKLRSRVRQSGVYGICDQLRPIRLDRFDCLRILFAMWPEWSGDEEYPVPYDGRMAREAYHDERRQGRLWADSPYGNSRRALLAFCIQMLEESINRRPFTTTECNLTIAKK